MVIIFQAVHKYIKNKALNGCKCFISFPLQYIEFERISIVGDAEIVGSIEVIYQFWKFPWPLICFTINSIFFKSFCVYVLFFFCLNISFSIKCYSVPKWQTYSLWHWFFLLHFNTINVPSVFLAFWFLFIFIQCAFCFGLFAFS